MPCAQTLIEKLSPAWGKDQSLSQVLVVNETRAGGLCLLADLEAKIVPFICNFLKPRTNQKVEGAGNCALVREHLEEWSVSVAGIIERALFPHLSRFRSYDFLLIISNALISGLTVRCVCLY